MKSPFISFQLTNLNCLIDVKEIPHCWEGETIQRTARVNYPDNNRFEALLDYNVYNGAIQNGKEISCTELNRTLIDTMHDYKFRGLSPADVNDIPYAVTNLHAFINGQAKLCKTTKGCQSIKIGFKIQKIPIEPNAPGQYRNTVAVKKLSCFFLI